MIGQTISHYRILEKLGEGGMGVVYKAQDEKLDRFVALKFLPHNLSADKTDTARFIQEAKSAAALNHPNICTIYAIEEVDGSQFIVMELVEGKMLKEVVRGSGFGVRDASMYAMQIAEALHDAHSHGIIHRDIKSENIMVNSKNQIKVMDFGLAKLRDSLQLTKTSSAVGTIAYMAPELIQGGEADARSDIFSFGIVLYEMFTGTMPFRGDHEAAVMYSIVNEDPQPPDPALPSALARIITRALEKDPAKRYQSCDEVARDLRSLNPETIGTVKTTILKQQSKLPRMIAAVLVLGAIGVYLFMPASGPTGKNSKTIAVMPFTNLSDKKEDEYFSDGMTDDILTQLTKIADMKVISRTTMMQYKKTKKSLKEIGKELSAGVVLEGSVRRAGDQIRIVAQLINASSDEHLWAETYDREFKQVFAIQSEIAQKIATSLKATLSPAEKERLARPATVNTEAYTAYLQGRYFLNLEGKENLEKAVAYYEKALQSDSNYAPAWVGLSMVHTRQANLSHVPRDEGFRKAQKEAKKALELDPNLAEAYVGIGFVKRAYDTDWTGADAAYRRALELAPGNATAVQGAGQIAMTLGRFDEGITLFRRAIELDPLRVATYNNLGLAAYRAGRWSEAEAAFLKALELNPKYSGAHMFLGRVYLAQSKTEAALAEMQKEREPAWRMAGLPLVYHAAGKKNEADAALAEAIKALQYNSAYQIAEIYAYRGETEKAFEWLERAYKQRDGGFNGMKGDPLLRSIEKDPRYAAFMKKIKLPL